MIETVVVAATYIKCSVSNRSSESQAKQNCQAKRHVAAHAQGTES